MAHDHEYDGRPPVGLAPIQPWHPRDLETIVNLTEMAAIGLTTTTRATFTRDELFAEVRAYGGPQVQVAEVDFAIVLPHLRFLRRAGRGRLALR